MRKIRRIPDAMRICLLEEIHPKLRALPPGRQALVALYARGLRIRLWLGRAWRHFRGIKRCNPGCKEKK